MDIFYEVFYQLTGIVILYAMFIIISSFKDDRVYNRKGIMVSVLFYFVSNNYLHFFKNVAVLNLTTTIIFFVMLGWAIGLTLKKIILSTIFTMLLLGIVEVMIGYLTGFRPDSLIEDMAFYSTTARVGIVILTYSIAFFMSRFKYVKKNIEIPISYWLLLFIFPTISLVFLLVMIEYSSGIKTFVVVGSVLLLLMNMVVFSLYDHLMRIVDKQLESQAIHHLNDSYKKQLELMKETTTNTRAFKHDIKRHAHTLELLLQEESYDKATDYLARIKEQVEDDFLISKTGNSVIDSIVNYEYSRSSLGKQQIQIVNTTLPQVLKIEEYDLTIVLSNILRNAFHAASKVKEGQVTVAMDFHKGMFVLKVTNNFSGDVNKKNGQYNSTKKAGREGVGLTNVEKVVHHYNGELRLSNTANEFIANISMYA